MKKILAALLCVTTIFVFAACGNDDGGSSDSSQQATASDEKENTKTDSESDGADKASGQLLADAKKAKLYSGKLTTGNSGDTLSNEFFDWKVNSVKIAAKLDGKSAGSGKQYVVVNVTIKNTTDYSYETGNYEFAGYVGTSKSDKVKAASVFYSKMLADTVLLDEGESASGDLVFKVDADVSEIIVQYQEIYEDDSTGDTNWFDLKL